jgi:CRISPR-associated protein Cas2
VVVLILERVPSGLRGDLNRWMLEPRAGTFVGAMPARVRERLWDKACKEARDGSCVMITTAPTDQGFVVRVHNEPARSVVDFDGLSLIRLPL